VQDVSGRGNARQMLPPHKARSRSRRAAAQQIMQQATAAAEAAAERSSRSLQQQQLTSRRFGTSSPQSSQHVMRLRTDPVVAGVPCMHCTQVSRTPEMT
jgi:hypothetical protein